MRPTTSNPKRRTSSLNSPLHKSTTPRGEHAANIEDLTTEVLWSDEHSVPASMLARPHTSNPRYAEMNHRDTPRKDVPHSSGSAPDSVVTSAPSRTPSEPSPERNVSLADHTTAVLWASDSVNIEPELLARPVTANPWLRRLFESGSLPEANWTRKESQILWSSIDVEDWRMLARPHASNPLLERGIGDDSSVPPEMTPITAHTHGEVLWQRDDEPVVPDAATAGPLNLAAAAATAQPPPPVATGGPLIASGGLPVLTAAMETIKIQSGKIGVLEGEVRQLRLAVQELSALVHRSFAPQNHQRPAYHSQQHLVSSQPQHGHSLPEVLAPALVGPAPEPRIAQDPITTVLDYHRAASHNLSVGGSGSLLSSIGYIPDPSMATSQVPTLRQEYPVFHAPSPPRRADRSASDALDPPAAAAFAATQRTAADKALSHASAVVVDDDAFVKEDDGVIEPQLEGLSARGPPSTALRPESAQVRSGHASSRIVQDLRDAVDGARPQSAPLHSYMDRKSGKVGRSTTYFAKDGSNALLLNNKAIVDQYQALIQPGHPFALKEDFKAMYLKKSSEFGMCVNQREIDRKLATFHTVGKDYLSLEEFSVLFLHIAQW